MTAKNNVFTVKAALLDPACQRYSAGQFNLTVPAGETWYAFNSWFCRFDYNPSNPEPNSGQPWFQRNLGVENYTILPAGTQIIGTNNHSFMQYARPSLVTSDSRYADAECLYYERMSRYPSLPFFKKGVCNPANTLGMPTAQLPTDMPYGFLISNITIHGGCWVTLMGGAVPGVSPSVNYIINTREEINDAHEVRFTAGHDGLQPIPNGWFTCMALGQGAKSDVIGTVSPEASFGSISGFKLPSDW